MIAAPGKERLRQAASTGVHPNGPALAWNNTVTHLLIFEKAFEQLVTRFHTFLNKREDGRVNRGGTSTATSVDNYGLLIEDLRTTTRRSPKTSRP